MTKEEFLNSGIDFNKYSGRELDKMAGVGETVTRYWLKMAGIKKDPIYKTPFKRLVNEDVIEKLVIEGFSSSQIAKKLNLTVRQVTTYRSDNKIGSDKNEHLSRFNKIVLSDVEKQVIIGSLLGDGNIDSLNTKRDYYRLCMSHGDKQLDYCKFKYNLIKNIAYPPKTRKRQDKREKFNDTQILVECKTIVNPVFKEYRERWYCPSKILCKEDFDNLEPLGLAIWYMDDGFRPDSPTFSTDCFKTEEVIYMAEKLNEKFGLKCSVQKSKNRLHIMAETRDEFFDLIRKYVPESMTYKLSI